jgi:2-amino-4-hydroxy-6-hydroxymethyldihydropteridine diphosphokinase
MNGGIYLLLGSNLGDTKANLARAATLLRGISEVRATSALYSTQAWGKRDQPDFLNQVIEIAYADSPENLLALLQDIEAEMGRVRQEKWGPRLIDIDILLFGNTIVASPSLIVPHPELPNRKFALLPLCELAGQIEHPILRESMNNLLAHCPDRLQVTRLL